MLHTISRNQTKYNPHIGHEDLWYTVVPNDHLQDIHFVVFCHGLVVVKFNLGLPSRCKADIAQIPYALKVKLLSRYLIHDTYMSNNCTFLLTRATIQFTYESDRGLCSYASHWKPHQRYMPCLSLYPWQHLPDNYYRTGTTKMTICWREICVMISTFRIHQDKLAAITLLSL